MNGHRLASFVVEANTGEGRRRTDREQLATSGRTYPAVLSGYLWLPCSTKRQLADDVARFEADRTQGDDRPQGR